MIFYCKFKHKKIDRDKVFNYCYKKRHCKGVGLFQSKIKLQKYLDKIKRDQDRYSA